MNSISIRKPFSSSNFLILISAMVLLLLACLINLKIKKPKIVLTKQDTAININTDFLRILSGGNKRLITDLLWIQTLIESDTEHYQKKDLNNWLFVRFNTISILDPKFYENYFFGGQFLNIAKDDLEGADYLYEKALTHFPNDYNLNYHAGFLNYYEIGDAKKGLRYLSKIADNPRAPIYIKSIINKLTFEISGDLASIFKLVHFSYEETKDNHLKKKLELDLYAIKAEIDLKCLNGDQKKCETIDLYGFPYEKRQLQFHSVRKFKRYRIKKRGETKSPLKDVLIDTIK